MLAGVTQLMVICWSPAVAVGGSGPAGTSTVAAAWLEGPLSPLALTACTSKVKVVGGLFAVRPFTV